MISTFTAVFDANVLYGQRIRSLLMYLTMSGLFRAKWSADIHREWMTAVSDNTGHDIASLESTRDAMDRAVPDALVTGYEGLIPAFNLPDPDDRHVLAAAVRCGASAIVTFNLKDFPASELEQYGIHTKHPDEFIMDVDGLAPGVVAETAKMDRLHYPVSADDYIDGIRRAGLAMVAAHLDGVRVLLEDD
jgi:predicted regulator of Ras-like GTPase activity (Roadblock/LC7/MglB family)